MFLPRRPVAGALLLLASGALASCGWFGYSGPPRSQNDICAIFAERPDWRDAMEASQRRWGAPIPVQMAIIWQESSFRSDARPPKRYILGLIPYGRISSAYGYAQALDGTWKWYRDETGNSGADRDDFEDSADFVGWYMAKSRNRNGIRMRDAYNQYLAYHEGHAGHRRGSHNKKGWLKRVANKVAGQAERYRNQFARCS